MQDKIRKSISNEIYSPNELEHLDRREQELHEYREHIREQERQLDEYRTKLKEEQFNRERELHQELEARERFFTEREKKLYERQKEFERTLLERQEEAERLKTHLEDEIHSREIELQQTLHELHKEKERYNEKSREKIELTSKDYVSEALDLLSTKEKEFHNRSKAWGGIGAFALVAGMVFFGYITIASLESIPNPVTWEFITFAVCKGLIVVLLFAALAKYSLIFSNAYMTESLKNADRRHAINFGKFYLESYGAAADWTQIKEAFEHWNISGENAFSRSENNKLDVTAIEKLATVIEKIGKLLPATK